MAEYSQDTKNVPALGMEIPLVNFVWNFVGNFVGIPLVHLIPEPPNYLPTILIYYLKQDNFS